MAFLFGQNYRYTAEQVSEGIDLRDKIMMVTGVTAGIGIETARVLSLRGARVIILGRNTNKLQEVAQQLNQAVNDPNRVVTITCDLSSFASIRAAANQFLAMQLPLHCLILNAGVMACEYGLTKEGLDLQFGTNHVGHFLLTQLLTDKLIASAPSRVVSVSSMAKDIGYGETVRRIDYTRLPAVKSEKDYSAWGAYQQSKLANMFFAAEFNKRYQARGVTAYSLHPGAIRTELQRSSTMSTIFMTVFSWFTKSVPEGAATQVYLAVTPGVEQQAGQFFADSKVTDHLASRPVEEWDKLWQWTERFIAEH